MRSSVRRAGKRLGTTRRVQPGPFGGPALSRRTSSSGGVIASCPGQKGQLAGSSWSGRVRTTAFGRSARSGATITQRPTTGSLRSSGMAAHHNILATRSLKSTALPMRDAFRSGAFGASTRGELAPPSTPQEITFLSGGGSDAPVGELELAVGNRRRDLAVAGDPVQLHLVAQDPHRERDALARLKAQRLAGQRELDGGYRAPRPGPHAALVDRLRFGPSRKEAHPDRFLASRARPGQEEDQLPLEVGALRRIQAQIQVGPGKPEPELRERAL